jgi:hypothetical protein
MAWDSKLEKKTLPFPGKQNQPTGNKDGHNDQQTLLENDHPKQIDDNAGNNPYEQTIATGGFDG